AQINPEMYAGMDEVNYVVGNDLKLKAETWKLPSPDPRKARITLSHGKREGTRDSGEGEGDFGTERVRVNDIMSVTETAGHLIDGVEGHARAFIQVQNGCDHRCTFCIIPYG